MVQTLPMERRCIRVDFLFVSIPNGFVILSADGELPGKISLGQVTHLAFDDNQGYFYITEPVMSFRLQINRKN